MHENNIIAKAKKGDETAIEYLLSKYEDRLFHLILKMTMNFDDSKDIMQETFLSAIKNIDRFNQESTFYTWLYRIAINKTLNHIKKAKNRQNISLEKCCRKMYEMKGLDEHVLSFELYKRMQEAIHKLPEKYRLPFIMANMEGLPYSEIADILKIKENTVKIRLFRARNILKESLKDYIYEM
ncbi:sigma-70 family RNA polymerase sigma factor [candidate division WOR-3 bacterium]|jgi:RNA polymerase sigma-70 factor (ECF subfamily)|nr:sigma-70 family RNA polymerase sigma factor [candidate division WOR-3 bacterium]HHD82830.1 sigma-70 family RNA polymerase sigma factor [Bacteroidota bacterium]